MWASRVSQHDCTTSKVFIKSPSDNSREVRRTIQKPKYRFLVKSTVILKGDEVEHVDSALEALQGGRKAWFRQPMLQGIWFIH